ncbi:chitin synthase [Halteromyces radiatus]|uniref:chitin synthase n=1 Tax=Halteromyces radiatus TaxID=101107 RepID=UPI002220FA41|nr:chitin synthase [Halteromyces radiatus]KAI8084634.1 chitin synthase [Halteromyces radiatus]
MYIMEVSKPMELPESHSLNIWKIYCYILTCCLPPCILSYCFGKKDHAAQYAFREKIGLVSVILYIMAFVGFLTFGFTQAVCPRPSLSFRMDQLNDGYVVIHGQAYLLASWNDHPPIPYLSSENLNPVYPPINAGGKDASFLFQNMNSSSCANVIVPKMANAKLGSQSLPTFFPCRMFNTHPQGNAMDVPDPATYSNHTGCHLTSKAKSDFESMRTLGVPTSQGTLDKAGRVYYGWREVNSTNHLAVFNSNVLNLNLLSSLSLTLFNVPPGGLIASALANPALFGGKDISHMVASHHRLPSTPLGLAPGPTNLTSSWKEEAYCLLDLIKVGEIDTKSVGCIASDIVLYTSLVVILGVILVKFGLAVIFGWCLSWQLGNFKEGRSYRERMQREQEIENWTTNINRPATTIRPQLAVSKSFLSTPKLPRTSRFTPPETGSMHFNAVSLERPGSALWKQSPSTRALGQFGSISPLSESYLRPITTPTPLTPSTSRTPTTGSENGRSNSSRRHSELTTVSRQSSLSSHSNLTHSSSSTTACPYAISRHAVPQPKSDYMPFGFVLTHTICLVTCYSEGEEGIRTTLDSIATTDYPNSHKLILVIADGQITGHGNAQSTPDICVSMMHEFLTPPDQVQAYSYVAIADGTKRHNMAKVYAGFYKFDDTTVDPSLQQKVPMITIAKCGAPEEHGERKPGNRGKRDSQVILMSFLQKVMFDERMTMLEYELFTNTWRITGVSPDKYEIVLMVDADTKVYPDALSRLISCMVNDDQVAGLCGETKIGNKTDSWVSMIQVFEYYISHHQTKAFESIFGNVTCLPGCFCMYRIKSPKGSNGHWVPILANPDIIEHYSENVVDTLHKKNLLLLGEDRYLSTLMLKTFPRRKMLFVPQAVCKTVVPDTFMVLLSQRRRWINSTIHNLMELLFVNDLCGTFCFSMQFVVFMELVGTLALPAAISFTMYLVVLAIMGQPAVVSLILLALILGLPAVLIVMTSRKLVYVGWMLIYLFSLPIWNFVMPTYAYWHFDDFTWGETRKVQGESKQGQHGEKEGIFDSSKITMKKWCEHERDRRLLHQQQYRPYSRSSL